MNRRWVLVVAHFWSSNDMVWGGAIQNVPNLLYIFLDIPNKSAVCVWTCSNLYTLLIAGRLLIQFVPTLCSCNPLIAVGVHGATNNTPGGTPYCQGYHTEQRASVYLREQEQTPYWIHMAIIHMYTCPHTRTVLYRVWSSSLGPLPGTLWFPAIFIPNFAQLTDAHFLNTFIKWNETYYWLN